MKNATNKKMGEMVFRAFVGLVFLINALLTFMFGGTYGNDTFPTSVPMLSFILGGLMLTVFYDFASFGWFIARSKENQSTTQRAIASVLAAGSMLASVAVSAIQLSMTTTLVDLSEARAGIGLFGLVLAVGMASAHFIGLFAHRYFDPVYQEQDAEADMQARMATFRLTQKERVADKMMDRVKVIMDGQVDSIAEGEAALLWGDLRTQLQTAPQLTQSHEDGPIIIDVEREEVTEKKAAFGIFINQMLHGYAHTLPEGIDMVKKLRAEDRYQDFTIRRNGEVVYRDLSSDTLRNEQRQREEDSPLAQNSPQPTPSPNGNGHQ